MTYKLPLWGIQPFEAKPMCNLHLLTYAFLKFTPCLKNPYLQALGDPSLKPFQALVTCELILPAQHPATKASLSLTAVLVSVFGFIAPGEQTHVRFSNNHIESKREGDRVVKKIL